MSPLEESEKLNELYRLYGIAMHHCCNIQYRIVPFLLVPEWSKVDDLNPEKVEEVYEKLNQLTLGNLLQKYKNHYSLTEQQIFLADSVLKKRNYLAHHFFGTYGKRMYNPEELDNMISELQGLITNFQSVSRSLDTEQKK